MPAGPFMSFEIGGIGSDAPRILRACGRRLNSQVALYPSITSFVVYPCDNLKEILKILVNPMWIRKPNRVIGSGVGDSAHLRTGTGFLSGFHF